MSAETHSDQIVMRVITAACRGAGRSAISHRGHHWVMCLVDGFRSEYPAEDIISHRIGGRKTVVIGSVRKKEMMFDILVAGWEQNIIQSTDRTTFYPRLRRPVWAVESEVAKGAPEVLSISTSCSWRRCPISS